MIRLLIRALGAAILVAASVQIAEAREATPYVNFESGPVRPVALSPNGKRLFVVNIPAGSLEVFRLEKEGPIHAASVPVGLDPVSLAVRNDGEVWVVNHVSDSVSIVDVEKGVVSATLLVGDEPRDIVFAAGRAFVTTAHRGQRRLDPALAKVPGAGDPLFETPGIGRADVWVFDAQNPRATSGGVPLRIMTLFSDTPRALVASPDGKRVYVAAFHSGNGTTTLNEGVICDGFDKAGTCELGGIPLPGGNPGPSTNAEGLNAPETGLIVRFDGKKWVDELGRDWSEAVRFRLPDNDVFALDTTTLEEVEKIAHVGTTLFGMAIHPKTGELYVSNTEARNEARFEGPGVHGGSSVRGNFARHRITVIRPRGVRPVDLNSHIDRSLYPTPPAMAEHSLSLVLDLAITADGSTLYGAALGSSRVGVFSTNDLGNGSFQPEVASKNYLEVEGGPSGLALDEARKRLYVYTRFDNALVTLDLETGKERFRRRLFSPEPSSLTTGRRLLYDARLTSSNGESSCATCHVFGDADQLAWDLGNPDEVVVSGTIPVRLPAGANGSINGTGRVNDFHPMKGPMTTQSLRGLLETGAQHWRGDRSVGIRGADPFDARVSFRNFDAAFPGLLGRESGLADEDLDALTDFVMGLVYPPNPVRALDGSLSELEAMGREFFTNSTHIADGIAVPNLGFHCAGCHDINPEKGHFGTDGLRAFQDKHQVFKIPQLRGLYQKVGMFGMLETSFFGGGLREQTPQVRGFGFLHDGSVDSLDRFLHARVFAPTAPNVGIQSNEERAGLVAFLLAFESDLAPIVGQQWTLAPNESVPSRINTLLAASKRTFVSKRLGGTTKECDVIVKSSLAGESIGYLAENDSFVPDDGGPPLTLEELTTRAAEQDIPLTFTAVVPGTGRRLGIDADLDDVPDGIDACPLDASASTPGSPCVGDEAPTSPPPKPQTPDPSSSDGCSCSYIGISDATSGLEVFALAAGFALGAGRIRRRALKS